MIDGNYPESLIHRQQVSNAAKTYYRVWLTVALLRVSGLLSAATLTWSGSGGNSDWENSSNWNPTGPPGRGDRVIIPPGQSETVMLASAKGTIIGSIRNESAL